MDVDTSSCQPAVHLVQAADPAVHVAEKLGEVVHSVCDVGMPDVRTEETRTGDQQPGPCASGTSSGTVAEHNNSMGSKVNHVF